MNEDGKGVAWFGNMCEGVRRYGLAGCGKGLQLYYDGLPEMES